MTAMELIKENCSMLIPKSVNGIDVIYTVRYEKELSGYTFIEYIIIDIFVKDAYDFSDCGVHVKIPLYKLPDDICNVPSMTRDYIKRTVSDLVIMFIQNINKKFNTED